MDILNTEIWLWLLLVMLPHNDRTMQLVEHYGGVRAAAEAIRDGKCELVSDEEKQRALRIRSREVNSIIDECRAHNIDIITIEDKAYPEMLRDITAPPVVLFVQGSVEALSHSVSLAVVGTRHPSQYAVNTASRICGELAALDVAIVSGLAVGIDSASHQAALDNGAPTVGVLACGSLVGYPAATSALRENILRSGGAVISELPPHTAVDPDYFCHRNRIISGLAHGTFVVEAPHISGCRFTAEHAIQQNRELFCLPPYDVFSNRCDGVVQYLRDGAVPVFGSVDIMNGLKYRIFGEVD